MLVVEVDSVEEEENVEMMNVAQIKVLTTEYVEVIFDSFYYFNFFKFIYTHCFY